MGLLRFGPMRLVPSLAMSPLTDELVHQRLVDVGVSLSAFRSGHRDPTCRVDRSRPGGAGVFHRATHTPDGPGTVRISWPGLVDVREATSAVTVDAWGPGGDWLIERVPDMVGLADPGAAHLENAPDAVVARAARECRTHRLGASHDLYHELIPTVIEQRIAAGEAKQQWRQLCEALSDPAPGNVDGLLLPPAPATLSKQPTWWFHPLGIERSRAETIREVARHASKYWEWVHLGPREAGRRLRLIGGVGQWTVGTVLSPALGDPDAVPVGDYHVKNVVAWALTGEPRGTDENMLQLLAPYAGDRGRVVRLLKSTVGGAPKFGPRKRILPMSRW